MPAVSQDVFLNMRLASEVEALPGECPGAGVVASALSLAKPENHSQDFVLSVQECEVDDTEERICELFFLAATHRPGESAVLGKIPW